MVNAAGRWFSVSFGQFVWIFDDAFWMSELFLRFWVDFFSLDLFFV
jgi:hypothetical protein